MRGYGDNIFGGDGSITREQMAVMIANFLKYVSGGGAFSNISRVPNRDYNKSVTDNI